MLISHEPYVVEIAHPPYAWYKKAVKGTVLYRRTEDEFNDLNILLAHSGRVNQPLGFLAYSVSGAVLCVDQLRSLKSGVGDHLLTACEQWGEKMGLAQIQLEAPLFVEDFYKRNGFSIKQDVDALQDQYLLMEKYIGR